MSSDTAILTGVRSLWEDDLLHDFTIQVEGRSFKVHKVILAAVSDYFRAMLTGGMAESGSDSVTLGVVSVGAMEVLIDFIYKNRMSLTLTNMADVLSAAVYLQIPSAIEVCTKYMLQNLSTEGCLDMHAILQSYSFPEETEKVKSFITDNVEEIVDKSDMKNMSQEWFSYFKDKWQGSEMKLFQFVQKWFEDDYDKRKEDFDHVMSEIRFCLLTPEELQEVKGLNLYQKGCGSWTTLVDAAIEYHNLPIHKKVLNDSMQNTVRSAPAPAFFVAEERRRLFCGSSKPDIVYDKLDLYIMDKRKHWAKCQFPMPQYCSDLSGHRVLVNNFLICSTGLYTKQPYNFYIFDPRTLTWTHLTSMEVHKSHYALLYHEEHLYIIGGSVGKCDTPTDSIEQYSFATNSWSHFTVLPHPRVWVCACVYKGSLYITGGMKAFRCDSDDLFDVHSLNLTSKVWESRPPATPEHELPRPLFALYDLFLMTLNGEQVLCKLDRRMQIGYYTEESNQWTRFRYYHGLADRLPWHDDGSIIISGNTLYYIGRFEFGEWKAGGKCLEMTFPEEGTGVSMKDIDHFLSLGYQYPGTISTMLSVSIEKITTDVVKAKLGAMNVE